MSIDRADPTAAPDVFHRPRPVVQSTTVRSGVRGGSRSHPEWPPDARSEAASSRELAIELGISRFTIVTAFDALIAELSDDRAEGGTFVAQVLPDLALRAKSSGYHGKTNDVARSHRASSGGSIRARTLYRGDHDYRPEISRRRATTVSPRCAGRSLSSCSLVSLVRRQCERVVTRCWSMGARGCPDCEKRSPSASSRGLRRIRWSSHRRAAAFNLIFHLLLNPDTYAREPDISCPCALARLERALFRSRLIGWTNRRLRTSGRRCALSDQYPTGASMSASRRLELLAWRTRRTHGSWRTTTIAIHRPWPPASAVQR